MRFGGTCYKSNYGTSHSIRRYTRKIFKLLAYFLRLNDYILLTKHVNQVEGYDLALLLPTVFSLKYYSPRIIRQWSNVSVGSDSHFAFALPGPEPQNRCVVPGSVQFSLLFHILFLHQMGRSPKP